MVFLFIVLILSFKEQFLHLMMSSISSIYPVYGLSFCVVSKKSCFAYPKFAYSAKICIIFRFYVKICHLFQFFR